MLAELAVTVDKEIMTSLSHLSEVADMYQYIKTRLLPRVSYYIAGWMPDYRTSGLLHF